MHGLPEDFDPSVIAGRTLEQVCFNSNQIALHFDDEVRICIESAYSHLTDVTNARDHVVSFPLSASDLMQLLESRVSHAAGDQQGTLTLTFENGHILKIYDNSEQYEVLQHQL